MSVPSTSFAVKDAAIDTTKDASRDTSTDAAKDIKTSSEFPIELFHSFLKAINANDLKTVKEKFQDPNFLAYINGNVVRIRDIIQFAVTSDSPEMMELILNQETIAREVASDHNYALRYACQLGYLSIVKMLLNNKAVLEAVTTLDNGALLTAAEYNRTEVIEELLKNEQVVSALKKDENNIVLRWAARNGNSRIVGRLLNLLMSDKNISSNAHDKKVFSDVPKPRSEDSGDLLIHRVVGNVEERKPGYVISLDKRIIDKYNLEEDMLKNAKIEQFNALHWAIQSADLNSVIALFEREIYVGSFQDQVETLVLAARKGSKEILEYLCNTKLYSEISKGNNVNAAQQAQFNTLFNQAVYSGDVSKANLLLAFNRFADVAKSINDSLALSAGLGHEKMVVFLLGRFREEKIDYVRILKLAAQKGQTSVVTLLFSKDNLISQLIANCEDILASAIIGAQETGNSICFRTLINLCQNHESEFIYMHALNAAAKSGDLAALKKSLENQKIIEKLNKGHQLIVGKLVGSAFFSKSTPIFECILELAPVRKFFEQSYLKDEDLIHFRNSINKPPIDEQVTIRTLNIAAKYGDSVIFDEVLKNKTVMEQLMKEDIEVYVELIKSAVSSLSTEIVKRVLELQPVKKWFEKDQNKTEKFSLMAFQSVMDARLKKQNDNQGYLRNSAEVTERFWAEMIKSHLGRERALRILKKQLYSKDDASNNVNSNAEKMAKFLWGNDSIRKSITGSVTACRELLKKATDTNSVFILDILLGAEGIQKERTQSDEKIKKESLGTFDTLWNALSNNKPFIAHRLLADEEVRDSITSMTEGDNPHGILKKAIEKEMIFVVYDLLQLYRERKIVFPENIKVKLSSLEKQPFEEPANFLIQGVSLPLAEFEAWVKLMACTYQGMQENLDNVSAVIAFVDGFFDESYFGFMKGWEKTIDRIVSKQKEMESNAPVANASPILLSGFAVVGPGPTHLLLPRTEERVIDSPPAGALVAKK